MPSLGPALESFGLNNALALLNTLVRLCTTKVSLSSQSTVSYWVMFHTNSLLKDISKYTVSEEKCTQFSGCIVIHSPVFLLR